MLCMGMRWNYAIKSMKLLEALSQAFIDFMLLFQLFPGFCAFLNDLSERKVKKKLFYLFNH